MARLHLLRRGTGDARVVGPPFEVPAERVGQIYGNGQVHVRSTEQLPLIDGGHASPFLDAEVAVIEFLEGDPAPTGFRSPGFNILVGVDPRDAYRNLIGQ